MSSSLKTLLGFVAVADTGASWTPVENPPDLWDTNLVVTNDSAADAMFYRLRKF
ncbi:MAG TPA: hypothetical protein VG938_04275 [Verrucomicrobiae bacterium]|jgi:hypothetical protein|nr:hypothetical protein [Verrucomicrobiae bacterium]